MAGHPYISEMASFVAAIVIINMIGRPSFFIVARHPTVPPIIIIMICIRVSVVVAQVYIDYAARARKQKNKQQSKNNLFHLDHLL